VDVKKLTLLAVIAFLLFFAVTSPDNAARIVQSIWDGLVHIANGIGEFIQRLSGNSSSA
jgi:hypothetical protein